MADRIEWLAPLAASEKADQMAVAHERAVREAFAAYRSNDLASAQAWLDAAAALAGECEAQGATADAERIVRTRRGTERRGFAGA